jgi:hypothetical protein
VTIVLSYSQKNCFENSLNNEFIKLQSHCWRGCSFSFQWDFSMVLTILRKHLYNKRWLNKHWKCSWTTLPVWATLWLTFSQIQTKTPVGVQFFRLRHKPIYFYSNDFSKWGLLRTNFWNAPFILDTKIFPLHKAISGSVAPIFIAILPPQALSESLIRCLISNCPS